VHAVVQVGLTVDLENLDKPRLCWADAILLHIACSDFEGNDFVKLKVFGSDPYVGAMSVLGSRLR
jgi:hypothetical protein